MFIQYILLGFLFNIGIGPVNVETAKRGLTGDTVSAVFFYVGNMIIDVLYIFLITFGFSFVVDNLYFKIIFGVLGISYLLYLGVTDIMSFKKKNIFAHGGILQKKKSTNSFIEGVMANLANPVAVACWMAFYGVVSSDFGKSYFNLIAVVIGIILSGGLIILVASFFKSFVGEKIMRIVSLLSGVTLIGYSLVFVYNLTKIL